MGEKAGLAPGNLCVTSCPIRLPLFSHKDCLTQRLTAAAALPPARCVGQQVTDLHRHFIDHLTIPSRQGKGVLRRVEDVFDCWFESGECLQAFWRVSLTCGVGD